MEERVIKRSIPLMKQASWHLQKAARHATLHGLVLRHPSMLAPRRTGKLSPGVPLGEMRNSDRGSQSFMLFQSQA